MGTLNPFLAEELMKAKIYDLEKEAEMRRLVRLARGDRPTWWATQSARLRCRWQNLRVAVGLSQTRCVPAVAQLS